ncbi:Solute carrier family 13 member 5 [Lamellibrachia satsuma]|nr:Solute carrier family 13 member 5 [Lamellibrachia satsuma]
MVHFASTPFAAWFAFWLPASFVILIIAWVWLQLQYSGIRSLLGGDEDETLETTVAVSRVMQEEYDKLGPFTYVTNATCAVLVTVCLFACPSKFPSLDQKIHPGGLLDWKTITNKVPWGVLLLLGGGYALADVSKTSGLSVAVGETLASLADMPPWVVAAAVTTIIAGLTEFTSNVTTTALLLPILAELSVKLGMNPLYLMIHGNIAATFAFMLPIATTSNAIVFAHGDLNIPDMKESSVDRVHYFSTDTLDRVHFLGDVTDNDVVEVYVSTDETDKDTGELHFPTDVTDSSIGVVHILVDVTDNNTDDVYFPADATDNNTGVAHFSADEADNNIGIVNFPPDVTDCTMDIVHFPPDVTDHNIGEVPFPPDATDYNRGIVHCPPYVTDYHIGEVLFTEDVANSNTGEDIGIDILKPYINAVRRN